MSTHNKKLVTERQILVIIKKPGQPPEVEPLFPNELEAFRKAVGGFIEPVTLCTDLVLLVNEEGRLLNLPYNTTVCGLSLYGTILAVGTKGPEFASIRASHVPMVMNILGGKRYA